MRFVVGLLIVDLILALSVAVFGAGETAKVVGYLAMGAAAAATVLFCLGALLMWAVYGRR